jgi:hypothetical protein
MKTYELIIELMHIPNGGRVRKITGDNVYEVRRDDIKIQGNDTTTQVIKCGDGCVFLIAPNSSSPNISIEKSSKKFVWIVNGDDLISFVNHNDN